MRRVLLLITMILLPIVASASVLIDGLYYELSLSTGAIVIKSPSGAKYAGNITIPETITYQDKEYSVTGIRLEAFYKCTGLTSITIPSSVTSIGACAFQGCTGLTSITIPSSVTSLGSYVFLGCTGLTSVIVENGNSVFDSRDNCNAIIETSTNKLLFGCKSTVIPNSVTSIGKEAFRECAGLTSIIIPGSVTTIGEGAFFRCTGLISVNLPNSVTNIESYAFQTCSSLSSIVIPNSVTYIGPNTFFNCSALIDVYCYAEQLPTMYDDFRSVPFAKATLHVPANSAMDYISTDPWNKFGRIVSLTDNDPRPADKIEVSAQQNIPIDEEHFPDSTFRKWLKQKWYGSDGILTPQEIAAVDSIRIVIFKTNNTTNPPIRSIKGIEYFTELDSLEADYGVSLQGYPTPVDLSKNVKLRYLDLRNNFLYTIDVSKLTRLQTLVVSGMELTGLDLSNNPDIRYVDAGYTNGHLRSLNLTGCTKLQHLDLELNGLPYEYLDLSEQTELEFLHLGSTRDTKIKEVNVSKCTKLKTFYCPHTLTTLDVSKNTALEELHTAASKIGSIDVTKNTNLKILDCRLMNLKSLDVTQNTKLTQLYVQDSIMTLDVSKCPKLKLLWCNMCGLSELDVTHNTSLENFECGGNSLTTINLQNNTGLDRFMCSSNRFTKLDVSHLNSLTVLGCENNQLTELKVSQSATRLSYIACYQNQLDSVAMTAFVNSLPTAAYGGELYLHGQWNNDGAKDQNFVSPAMVAQAKAKGYNVYHYGSYGAQEMDDAFFVGIEKPYTAATKSNTLRFGLDGRRLDTPQRGLNIIRMSDGTVKKVMVK